MYLNITLLKIISMKTMSSWIKLDLIPAGVTIWAHYLSSLELGVNEAKVRGSFPIWGSQLHIKTVILFHEFTLSTLFSPYVSWIITTGHSRIRKWIYRAHFTSLLVERILNTSFLRKPYYPHTWRILTHSSGIDNIILGIDNNRYRMYSSLIWPDDLFCFNVKHWSVHLFVNYHAISWEYKI